MERSFICFILQHALLWFWMKTYQYTRTSLFLFACTWHLGDLEQLTNCRFPQSLLLHADLISARSAIGRGWSQTISPFHLLLHVCASYWHIYFALQTQCTHTYTATSDVSCPTHTPGECVRENLNLYISHIHFNYCILIQGFPKTLGLL